MDNGRIDLFPDLQGERLFRIHFRQGNLIVQPAGYVGFIPLNSRVALEIAPRIPVANIEYLLSRSGRSPAITLPYLRQFSTTATAATPFLQLLAMRYNALLGELRYEGVFKAYAPRKYVGTNPSGRVYPAATALLSRLNRRATAVFERFDRTVDNDVNRLILAAGQKVLHGGVLGDGSSKLLRSIKDRLLILKDVREVKVPTIPRSNLIPAHRPFLEQLVAVSAVILSERGVRLRGEGQLRLPTFLIKMDEVFEAYVRTIMQEDPLLSHYTIKDGNALPPSGASTSVFLEPGPLGNRDATPDITISVGTAFQSVFEVKYKPCPKHPDRDHLNQLLTYALIYSVKRAVLIYPAGIGQQTGVTDLGLVQGIMCFKAIINLSDDDLSTEESKFCEFIRNRVLSD